MKKAVIIIGIIILPIITFIVYHQFNQFANEPRLSFKSIEQIAYLPNKSIDAIELVNEYANIDKIDFPVVKNELGEQILVYKIIGKNGKSQVYSKKINIMDKTPPIVALSQTEIDTQDTIDEATMKSFLQVEDDVTHKEKIDIQLQYEPFSVGKNEVHYQVCDENENCSKAVLIVNKKEVEKENAVESATSSTPTQNNPRSQSNTQREVHQPVVTPAIQKPAQTITKRFWYKDGYNKKTGFVACQNFVAPYENTRATSCKPFSENNQELGYEAIVR